jgi:hypothetical protein
VTGARIPPLEKNEESFVFVAVIDPAGQRLQARPVLKIALVEDVWHGVEHEGGLHPGDGDDSGW